MLCDFICSNPSITYAPGLSIDVPKVPRGQGHPLQSFSVPGPPPSSLNTTPLISNPNKHSSKFHSTFDCFNNSADLIFLKTKKILNEKNKIYFHIAVPAVAIRPQNSSPYKKSLTNSIGTPMLIANTLTNRLQQSGPMIVHSSDEIQRLAPSTSTEELNQEMANLEGLMKDLSAITASEFEC